MNVGLVCLMGMSIVFIGLLCIVLLCTVMSKLVLMSEKGGAAPDAESHGQPVKLAAPAAAPGGTAASGPVRRSAPGRWWAAPAG